MKKILVFITLSIALLNAGTIKVDSPLELLSKYKYETPNGRQMKIPKKTELIIIAFEKDTGALVNTFLAAKNPFYLMKNRSIFIADINKMPTIITNMFALPKLRKYSHLIYLHYGEKFQHVIPHKDEKITLLEITDSKITNISFISNTKELEVAIEK